MDIERLLFEYTKHPENSLNIREELMASFIKNNQNPFQQVDELSLKSISELVVNIGEVMAVLFLLNNLRLDQLEEKLDKLLENKEGDVI